ncbi:MAG: sulfinoalanine decarboxylase [Bacteroidia bacterium]|jgi:sulfinoalanine decarboxylase
MQSEIQFFKQLVDKLISRESIEPVVKPLDPDQLDENLNINFEDEGLSDSEWEQIVSKVVLHTPRTSSKLFFNQLFGGRQDKAVIGDLLAVILNNSMYTYKVAGPQVGIEKAILTEVCKLVGYSDKADGTIAPGGSMSNFMAMIMGRDRAVQTTRNQGVTQKMTLYTSVESHYSIPKNASFMGVGRDHVRYVKTNSLGEMDPVDLARQVEKDKQEGFTPFFVNVTAGTTVLGAFDRIPEVSTVCKEHNLWLHVDGAYCGGVIFSKKYKHLLNGIELSDSFSFNAHKMLGTPLTCSIVVTKNREDLSKSFSNDAEYLYQTDADDFDLGKTSIQCGRRNDALKLWTLWKAVGNKGLSEIVDNQFYLADVARQYVTNHSDYTLYSYPDSVSVCFNYKNIPATTLCTLLYEDAATLVGYGKFEADEFVRLVTVNSTNTKEDILHFFKTLEEAATSL